jgi:tetratricopeptide (TPR) repeat protein
LQDLSFSRANTRNALRLDIFFATLAYQAASIYSNFKEIAIESILDNPALLDPDKSLREQMEKLFLWPLWRLRMMQGNCPPLVFVVDALHECASKAEVADLIALLAQVLREPHVPVIHILLTSNTQTHIREAFQKAEVRPLVSEIRASTSGEILAMDVASRGLYVTGDLPHILTMNLEPRNACITGDLSTAEELLTKEIQASGVNNHQSYANRSFVMARKYDWDHALEDALQSVSLHPSLTGYISKGIALCGKNHLQDAIRAFDLASVFTNSDSETTLLLLIKAVALFNANQHEDAILRVQELVAIYPKIDALACRVVEACLCVHLGTNALNGGRHSEAADHFTAAVKTCAFISQLDIHSKYQDFVVLFGWDLKSLWKNANQKKCDALLRAGRLGEAVESHRYMMDMSDGTTKANCLEWSTSKS